MWVVQAGAPARNAFCLLRVVKTHTYEKTNVVMFGTASHKEPTSPPLLLLRLAERTLRILLSLGNKQRHTNAYIYIYTRKPANTQRPTAQVQPNHGTKRSSIVYPTQRPVQPKTTATCWLSEHPDLAHLEGEADDINTYMHTHTHTHIHTHRDTHLPLIHIRRSRRSTQ